MLSADGFRLLRVTITRKKLPKTHSAATVRQACQRKGLVLDLAKVNPSMPFRYRDGADGVVTIEQVQIATGNYALAPPEQADFVERFLQGETWVGMVKNVRVP